MSQVALAERGAGRACSRA